MIRTYNDGTDDVGLVYTMTLTEHERAGWRRAATALDARGITDTAQMLAAAAAKGALGVQEYDRAASAYRAWLVFNEPRP